MLAHRPISTRLPACELTLCFPWDWISKAFWTWISGNSRGIIAQCLPFSDDGQLVESISVCACWFKCHANVKRHRWPCSLPKTTVQRWLHGNRLFFSNTGRRSVFSSWNGEERVWAFPSALMPTVSSVERCVVSVWNEEEARCSENSLWLQVQNKEKGLSSLLCWDLFHGYPRQLPPAFRTRP